MQEWTDNESYLTFGWFIVWVLLSTFALYVHNLVLPYIYFIYAVAVYVGHLYLNCTRCPYFTKKCYLLGGIFSRSLFKGREEKPMEPDDSLSAALWFILGVFPSLFLLYYQDWILFSVCGASTYGWFVFKKWIVRKKCGESWCPSK